MTQDKPAAPLAVLRFIVGGIVFWLMLFLLIVVVPF